MVHLTRSGPVFSASEGELAAARAQFAGAHWLRLPGFVGPELLARLQRLLAASEFVRVDRHIGTELRPADKTADVALCALLNNPALFRFVERLAGHGHVRSFIGRIYRRLPHPDYFHHWHDDVTAGGRLFALSINLSERPYAGGALRIRSAETREVLSEVHNGGAGDAVLFRIDRRLQHCIGPVSGDSPKTAMAGWFKPERAN